MVTTLMISRNMRLYFNFCRGGISIFESATGVIISCICWSPSDVIVKSLRMPLGPGTPDSILSAIYEHQLGGIIL